MRIRSGSQLTTSSSPARARIFAQSKSDHLTFFVSHVFASRIRPEPQLTARLRPFENEPVSGEVRVQITFEANKVRHMTAG